jgi:alpha-glucosidase
MVDPATFSGTPNQTTDTYETFNSGVEEDIFLKLTNGDLYEGVVWPGPTVFPDWTHQNAQSWWNSEFAKFFDPATGVDVSGIWLDMNEPGEYF